MVKVPVCTEAGALRARYRTHIDALWDLVPLHNGVEKFARSLVPILRMKSKPFENWSADQRYDSGDDLSGSVVIQHRDAARRILGAVGLLGERGKD